MTIGTTQSKGEMIVYTFQSWSILFIYLYSPNWNLKGLQAPPEKSIAVTFHAIVPKLLWECDDSSCMHIRFGHKDLGMWQHNVGDFIESRYMYVLMGN